VYVTRVWSKEGLFGTELAEITLCDGELAAIGVAVAIEPPEAGRAHPSPDPEVGPRPYRLDYYLETGQGYVTRRLIVRARGQVPAGGSWRRELDLQRSEAGAWSCATESDGELAAPPPGGDLDALAGALDCDLALSPLTNTMPVLRHGLHQGGGTVDFLMAWVSVPDLSVHPSAQRYTFAGRDRGTWLVRFESLDPGEKFTADIRMDTAGVALDYPGIARKVA
jgi:uncharacterized protein